MATSAASGAVGGGALSLVGVGGSLGTTVTLTGVVFENNSLHILAAEGQYDGHGGGMMVNLGAQDSANVTSNVVITLQASAAFKCK